jgi:hypothetical protein
MQFAPKLVANVGEVAEVQIPHDWTELQSHEFAERIVRVWQYDREPRVRFVSYQRNGELSLSGAGAFTKILYDEFNNLNRPELSTLVELLEATAKPDVFEISAAYTSYLNDRRTLRIDGTWIKDAVSSIGIWVDVDGKGRKTQQLAFLAPKETFEVYFAEAKAIFGSIRWKP